MTGVFTKQCPSGTVVWFLYFNDVIPLSFVLRSVCGKSAVLTIFVPLVRIW